jgi:hypothetical protein
MIRLRSIEANDNCIIIYTTRGPKKVNYSDIIWVTQIALIRPEMISIKYYDKESDDYKKILVLPSFRSQNFRITFFKDNEMTEYIKEKIMAKKTDYSIENELSRWLPILYIFLTGVLIKEYFI